MCATNISVPPPYIIGFSVRHLVGLPCEHVDRRAAVEIQMAGADRIGVHHVHAVALLLVSLMTPVIK